jgi:hypothetical protein
MAPAFLASCRENSGKQRQNSGPFAVISPVELSESRISAAHDVPLAVNFRKNSEKQRELTRNPLVFVIAQAFEPAFRRDQILL